MKTNTRRKTRLRQLLAVCVPLCVLLAWPQTGALHAQSGLPAAPPAEWGPVSINMEDVPYPHPVGFLELKLYGNDVRLAYMDVAPVGQPNGQTVVLLHGGSYFAKYWAGTIEALRNEGFRVVAVDQIGWGQSSKPIIPYSLNLHAANTRKLLDHLDITRAAVVGHSMGGMLAARFAFSYPETTTHVAMVNPVGLTDSRAGRGWEPPAPNLEVNLEESYRSILRREQGRVTRWKPEYLEFVRIHYGWLLSGEWPRLAWVRAMNDNSADPVVYDWPHIKTKALVIGGEVDGPRFPELARNVAETLPNAELVLFPDVGHNPHLEVPELFQPELIRFLRSDPDVPAAAGRSSP